MKRLFAINTVFFCIFALQGFAQEFDENNDGKTDKWVTFGAKGSKTILVDRDYNGKADYLVVYDGEANIKEEQLDFNNDGEMDDFYYYSNSVLIRREIDSNYDNKIDIWVYIKEGVYIEKYEWDTDYDGVIDKTKNYGE